MNPIHPSLAPLARAAKKKDWTELGGALAEALRAPAWLRPEHRVGDPAAYMRHLLYVDPAGEFVVTAITWLPGQKSAVHSHQVWCLYGVAEGELTEEQLSADLKATKTSLHRAGDIADSDLECTRVHRVSNRGRAPLVSLHLYGVAAERVTTGINRVFKI